MLTRLQVWILFGCFVLVGGIFLALALWPHPGDKAVADVLPPAAAEAPPLRPLPILHHTPLPDRYFRLTVKGQGALHGAQGEEKGIGEVELKYAHQKSVDGVILTFYSAAMKTFENGRLRYGFEVDRDKFVEQFQTRTNTRGLEELSPEQQEKMKAAFATNYCRVLLDGNQNETGREILSPLGVSIINEGLVDSTRLVHGPFCPGLNSWQATKRIPITPGMVLECNVQYKKVGATGNQIQVSGTAAKAEIAAATPGVLLKNISCTLSGTESFDETSWEYASAELTLVYSFEVFEQNASNGTMKGELVVSLAQVTR
ncbi:MAG TPA: hypothetical protein VN794_04235 [Methylomirabilota bacterium]|jgi:hypothetical protein|nr:hypothetical protein [Methylomirabilota bacterium]